ncbi:uncharacterized protein LOC144022459 [Festucalex cinctus]
MPPIMRPTDQRKGSTPPTTPTTSPELFSINSEGMRSCFDPPPPILITSSPECSDNEENVADVTFLETPVQRGDCPMDVPPGPHSSGVYQTMSTVGPYDAHFAVVRKDESIGGDGCPSTSAECYGGLTSAKVEAAAEEGLCACSDAGPCDDVNGACGKENLPPLTQTLSITIDTRREESSSPVARGIPAWALSSESSAASDTSDQPVWNFSSDSAFHPSPVTSTTWEFPNGLSASAIPPPPPQPRSERDTLLDWTQTPFMWVNNARYQCIKQAVSFMLRIAILRYSRKTCEGCFYSYICRNNHTCFNAPRRPYYFGTNFDAIIGELCNGHFRSTIYRVVTVTNHPSSDADVKRIIESVLHGYVHERLILDRITTVLSSTWDGYLADAIPDLIRGLYDRDG